ncbi:tetratricopeptide repeat protein [Hahella ganghwensis]|uniref:tetratricopeptide repeat protein n=1 Tax=Hahella ganghwensis TaxID=286420 RepID=UPI0014613ADE|nr:tetratricopeptide repeat protein [Hahella ganghwensis]
MQEQFNTAKELFPSHPGLLYEEALMFLSTGNFDEAEKIIKDVISQGINDGEVLYLASYCCLMGRKPQEALSYLEVCYNANRSNIKFPILMARIQYFLRALENVEDCLEEALQLDAASVEALSLFASCKLDQGDYDAAKSYASQALALDSDDANSLGVIAYCNMSEMNFDLAQAQISKALNIKTDSGRLWIGQALLSMRRKDLAMAEEQFLKGLTHMPGHIGSWNALAWCRILQNDLPGAKDCCGKAIELDGRFGETYGALAVVELFSGNIEAARNNAKKAIRLDKNNFSGYFAQALCEHMSGDKKKASEIVASLLNSPVDESGKTLTDYLATHIVA